MLTGVLAAATLLLAGQAHADNLLCSGSACHTIALRASPITAAAGTRPVGRIDTELTSTRDIMVSIWYPTLTSGTTSYIPATNPLAETRIAIQSADWMHTPDAATAMIGATIPASQGAPITPVDRIPVVIMSPGLGTPRSNLTGLASDLASHGYVVVTIDHTGETPAVEFPDGRVVYGADILADDPDYMRARLADRIADTETVLNQLPTLPMVGPHIDLDRIAVGGHSYGGTTAVQTMAQDPRVRAAVIIDGPAGWPGVVDPPLPGRPVLTLQLTVPWPAVSPQMLDTDHATITGAAHYSATDLCALGGGTELCGTINPDRATTISRGLIGSWLDRTLRNTGEPRYTAPELVWQTAAQP